MADLGWPILIPFHLSSSGSLSAMKIMWEWNEVVSLKAFGEHSTNLRVYPAILGCIFFPQVESSMSYKFTMKLTQLKKKEMEMRKNTPPHTHRENIHIYLSKCHSPSTVSQQRRKMGLELIICNSPWLLHFPSEFNSKKRNPVGFLPSGIITSKLTDI